MWRERTEQPNVQHLGVGVRPSACGSLSRGVGDLAGGADAGELVANGTCAGLVG